jgi:hypothetical protein
MENRKFPENFDKNFLRRNLGAVRHGIDAALTF